MTSPRRYQLLIQIPPFFPASDALINLLGTFNATEYLGHPPRTLHIPTIQKVGGLDILSISIVEAEYTLINGHPVHSTADFNRLPQGNWTYEVQFVGGPQDGLLGFIPFGSQSMVFPRLPGRSIDLEQSDGWIHPRYSQRWGDPAVFQFDGYV